MDGDVAAARGRGGGALAGRTILGIFAHPDDESLGCGGTLARAADAGARVILFCASRGEGGRASDPTLVPDGDLGCVRTEELRRAAAVLGVADCVVMSHRDRLLRWNDEPELQAEILATILRHQPDAVITFAEDGLYWHPDHIAVHERTNASIQSLGDNAPPLYYVTMPPGLMRKTLEAARATAGAPSELSFWGITPDAFGCAAEPPTFVVDVRNWAARKLAALRCHRTQIGTDSPFWWIDQDQASRCLGIEHFRRSPFGSRRDPVLERLAGENPGI